jgi:hypothetical protein
MTLHVDLQQTMSWLSDKLLSPNYWVLIASLLGTGGLVCVVIGFLTGRQGLMHTGVWLCAPLILGGGLLLVAVIPVLMVHNWKHQRE